MADDTDKGPWDALCHRNTLLGDAGGVRPWLDNYGVSASLTETSELFDSAKGGIERGSSYDGLTTLTLQLDTKKSFSWDGGLFNVSGTDQHGRSNFSAKKFATLQTTSGTEADNGVRLWEVWYQQSFADGKADVRIGQQSIDQEFIISSNATFFANAMLGWPMLPSADLPSGGGPVYPLASPGIRLHAQASDSIALLAGVFNDNPSGVSPTSTEDVQRLNRHGTNFRMNDDALVIAEIQYSRPGVGDMHYAGESDILPGTYRLGAWYDFGQFADKEYGTDGLSLATGNGIAQLHRGNYSFYAIADQVVWRPDTDSSKGLGVFMRAMGAPQDRNLIDFSLNAGFTYKGLIPDRDNDTFGIGYGLANVSSSVSNFDRQSGTTPVRSYEQFVEATYVYQLLPSVQLQPDFQYVFNPGAGVTNPNDPTGTIRLKDEAVIGIRTNISF